MRIRSFANTIQHIIIILSIPTVTFVSCADPKTAESTTDSSLSVEDSTQAVMLADSGKMLLYQKWDLPAARSIFEEALQINPRHAGARADLAWHHVLYNRSDDALREMKQAMQDDPTNPRWPAWLGWLHLGNGNLDQANDAVMQSLAIDPDYAEGLHVKSKVAVATQDFETAIATHERAASIDPRWRPALAHTYALSGDREKATDILETMEDNLWNTYGRVKVHLALSEKDKALEWLQKAYDQRHPYFPWCGQDYELKEIWDTPEFQKLHANLGF